MARSVRVNDANLSGFYSDSLYIGMQYSDSPPGHGPGHGPWRLVLALTVVHGLSRTRTW